MFTMTMPQQSQPIWTAMERIVFCSPGMQNVWLESRMDERCTKRMEEEEQKYNRKRWWWELDLSSSLLGGIDGTVCGHLKFCICNVATIITLKNIYKIWELKMSCQCLTCVHAHVWVKIALQLGSYWMDVVGENCSSWFLLACLLACCWWCNSNSQQDWKKETSAAWRKPLTRWAYLKELHSLCS